LAKWVAVVLLVLPVAIAGCGGGGVSTGATVAVYAAPSLCREARGVASAAQGRGDLETRVVCLSAAEAGGGAALAVAGSNARRATEDSTAVAFLEAPGPTAKFTRSIVEAAGVAWLEAASGQSAMRRVVAALEDRGSSSPRSAVLDQVG
jgi:hypothetical protein